jgi:hypothetical protein
VAEEQKRGDVHEQRVPLERHGQRERRDDEGVKPSISTTATTVT